MSVTSVYAQSGSPTVHPSVTTVPSAAGTDEAVQTPAADANVGAPTSAVVTRGAELAHFAPAGQVQRPGAAGIPEGPLPDFQAVAKKVAELMPIFKPTPPVATVAKRRYEAHSKPPGSDPASGS